MYESKEYAFKAGDAKGGGGGLKRKSEQKE